MNTTTPLLCAVPPRTDEQIVSQTNDLARLCLRYTGTGYEVPADHKFYEAPDPRSHKAWKFACELQEFLTGTDPNDALTAFVEPVKRYVVRSSPADGGYTYQLIDTVRDDTVMASSLNNDRSSIEELETLAATMNRAEEEE